MNWINNKEVSVIFYVCFWGLIIFGATFPNVLLNGDFSFLLGENIIELSKSYLFALTMVVILHLIDTAYLVFSNNDIEKEQLKRGLILNFIFLALIALSLILIVAVSSLSFKIIYFILFWIFLLFIKYLSIKITQPINIELNTTN